MLLDSNIIIYAHKLDYQPLRAFLKNKELSASMISYLETLGYHKITETEKKYLQ
jgi:toxin FitB